MEIKEYSDLQAWNEETGEIPWKENPLFFKWHKKPVWLFQKNLWDPS